MFNELLKSFVTFFTVIDPIGTIPVFIAVTAAVGKEDKGKIALKAALISAGVLLFFIVVGELILNAIDIPLYTFQIAGGIVLFIFALSMIFGEGKPQAEMNKIKNSHDLAVFPLAMPSLASPGAILAAIMLTENSTHPISEQVMTAAMMILVILIAYVFMRLAGWIFKYIGTGGAAIISRVMGLILSAVAVANVLEGFNVYFRA